MEENAESPFAAFAAPKRSAVEEFQEKQRNAARSRRLMIGCVLSNLVGAVGGATFCVAFDTDPEVAIRGFAGSLIGGLAGLVVGPFIGGACFSVMVMTGTRRDPSFESNLVNRDPMTAMRGLMFAWSLIVAAFGSAYGAWIGVGFAGARLDQLTLGRGTFFGSVIGGGFAMAVWVLVNRRLRSAAAACERAAADS